MPSTTESCLMTQNAFRSHISVVTFLLHSDIPETRATMRRRRTFAIQRMPTFECLWKHSTETCCRYERKKKSHLIFCGCVNLSWRICFCSTFSTPPLPVPDFVLRIFNMHQNQKYESDILVVNRRFIYFICVAFECIVWWPCHWFMHCVLSHVLGGRSPLLIAFLFVDFTKTKWPLTISEINKSMTCASTDLFMKLLESVPIDIFFLPKYARSQRSST